MDIITSVSARHVRLTPTKPYNLINVFEIALRSRFKPRRKNNRHTMKGLLTGEQDVDLYIISFRALESFYTSNDLMIK